MHPVNAKRLRLSLSAAILMTLLSGCATVGSNTTFVTRCPPLTSYSKATQRKAAEDLRKLPPGSPVRDLVSDYGRLRDACRSLKD